MNTPALLTDTSDMKTLGFAPDLIPLVLDGSKTVTWRLFDDKNISVGNVLQCVHQYTRRPFAEIIVISVIVKKLKYINDTDRLGHENVGDFRDILNKYQKYYSVDLTGDEEVKIIRFKLNSSYKSVTDTKGGS